MEIPLQAQVECTDGICGRSEFVLMDPLSDKVTNLVVREITFPNTEYIVPVEAVSETIADTISIAVQQGRIGENAPVCQNHFCRSEDASYESRIWRWNGYLLL